MPNILSFSRSRCTSVEQVDDQTLRSTCRLQDTLMDALVEITVQLPDLEITGVSCEVRRAIQKECKNATESLQKALGIRIGPGMLKIIQGLVGEATECKQLAFMVEECCHGVILAFTKDTLSQIPDGLEPTKEDYGNRVRDNMRMFNRCAAFAPGSSLVEGIEPPSDG